MSPIWNQENINFLMSQLTTLTFLHINSQSGMCFYEILNNNHNRIKHFLKRKYLSNVYESRNVKNKVIILKMCQ